jgi:hypothetical protein
MNHFEPVLAEEHPRRWEWTATMVGLSTVYRINGMTDAAYGGRHRTVRVLSGFGPYTGTAQ